MAIPFLALLCTNVAAAVPLQPEAKASVLSAAVHKDAACAAAEAEEQESYPRQYVAHRVKTPPTIDGRLDEQLWKEVPWTEDFVDIADGPTPRKRTRAKIRWDEDFLYVGAWMDEDEIWAYMKDNQVIYHDNDFEVFLDPSGSTHYYKEYEVNAAAKTWSLCLNKPYGDGGYENSTRPRDGWNGKDGWNVHDQTAVHVDGVLNDAKVHSKGWSVEVALPMAELLVNHTGAEPAVGKYWRMSFSRVEWRVLRNENGTYTKDPEYPAEDNWVWQHIGVISMHQPERWGILQFADENVLNSAKVHDPTWSVRHRAAALYEAEHAWAAKHDGQFTDSIEDLLLLETALARKASCSPTPIVSLGPDNKTFLAQVQSTNGHHTATITDDRLMKVRQKPVASKVELEALWAAETQEAVQVVETKVVQQSEEQVTITETF
eukprot:gnl/TRDRNA2_/TRDRNA2_43000_c0_seq1.p1 gnl/TRDRNA2_/TRDRNA2_43000_c0~~gnl/TRDRNA2_/TRDRNA2_43000_c0_seq1.p1  ORF type:complete len:432 (-),score=97.56 gnl/TRDRNA2_/TRDRNA2_43000_c0_seq1:23-1318(-)